MQNINDILIERSNGLQQIADAIKQKSLPDEWEVALAEICLLGNFYTLTTDNQTKIDEVVDANSQAVLYLAQKGRTVGLSMLHKISMGTDDEQIRQACVKEILNKGVKESAKSIDLLLSAKPARSLFDEVGTNV